MFINIQLFAHKKGMGSSKNGRDSAAQRLGVKRSDGQFDSNLPFAEINPQPFCCKIETWK